MYKWLNNINTRHSRVHSIFIRTFSTLRKVNTIRSKIRKRDKFFTRLIKHIISYYNNQPLSLPFEKNAIRVISKHNFAKSKKNLCLRHRLPNSSRWTTQSMIELLLLLQKKKEQSISISTTSVKYPSHIIDFPTATLPPLFEGMVMARWGRDKMAGSVGNS